ncbi:MAG: DUF6290 family protein [Peptococcaceae bacterium]|nr:DUF6290 family protein [Peptococcaceae bacterium]
MVCSIRLSPEERQLVESYAKLHSMTLSEAFKQAIFDKIEEEYDIAVADAAYDEYVKSGKPHRPFSELCEELAL